MDKMLTVTTVREFVPLPEEVEVIIVPDSAAGLCDPIPDETALVVAPTLPIDPAVDVPDELWPLEEVSAPTPVLEYSKYDASDYIWYACLTVGVSCTAGILWILGYYVVYPIVMFFMWISSFIGAIVTSGFSALLLAGLVGVVWAWVGRQGSSGSVKSRQVPRRRASVAVSASSDAPSPVRVRTVASRKTKLIVDTSAPKSDDLTSRWVQTMRANRDKQANGSLDGYQMVDENGCVVGDPVGSHCAAGWLLEVNGDKNLRRAKRDMERKYSRSFLRKVAKKNDSGTSLPDIAEFVERNVK